MSNGGGTQRDGAAGASLRHSALRIRASSVHSSIRAFIMAAVFVAAGCGYNAKELFPAEYQTVAVPMFENKTFYRGIEMDLSEALVKEIEARTPYKVVQRGGAGTELTGTITAVEQDLVSRRASGGLPQEVEVIVVVDFAWKDLRTGQPIRDRQGFEAVGRYVPARPVGQPYEVAQHAAVEQLAEDIVSVMQAEW